MKMKRFSVSPNDYQNHIDAEGIDKKLAGAVHVETYTKDDGRFGGDQTLVIFAFYPDEEPNK